MLYLFFLAFIFPYYLELNQMFMLMEITVTCQNRWELVYYKNKPSSYLPVLKKISYDFFHLYFLDYSIPRA